MIPPDDLGPEADLLKKHSKEEEAPDYSAKAKFLVRVVAGGFILVGCADLVAYWLKARHDAAGISAWHCVMLSIPLVIGVVILIKTSALAGRLEEWLDD
jgi:hypothetical protein